MSYHINYKSGLNHNNKNNDFKRSNTKDIICNINISQASNKNKLNDVIYQKIVTPVWVAMLILTFVYFVYCVQKSLVFDEKILEDYTYEIRI